MLLLYSTLGHPSILSYLQSPYMKMFGYSVNLLHFLPFDLILNYGEKRKRKYVITYKGTFNQIDLMTSQVRSFEIVSEKYF